MCIIAIIIEHMQMIAQITSLLGLARIAQAFSLIHYCNLKSVLGDGGAVERHHSSKSFRGGAGPLAPPPFSGEASRRSTYCRHFSFLTNKRELQQRDITSGVQTL